MLEYPDVPLITWQDEVVGQAQLSVVRKLGLPARVARVFLVKGDEILLQERSSNVDHGEVKDCSAEGWVDMTDLSEAGEPGDYTTAGARETEEELGLTIARDDLTAVAHYLLQIATANPPEWTKLFVIEHQPSRQGIIQPNDEVAGTQWVDVHEAHQWAQNAPQDFEPGAPLALDHLVRHF